MGNSGGVHFWKLPLQVNECEIPDVTDRDLVIPQKFLITFLFQNS